MARHACATERPVGHTYGKYFWCCRTGELIVQFVSRRPPAFAVCVKCGRRDHQMPFMASDEVNGLCIGCVATVQAIGTDPLHYLNSRVPRVKNEQLTRV
jgi:hypothetical protein